MSRQVIKLLLCSTMMVKDINRKAIICVLLSSIRTNDTERRLGVWALLIIDVYFAEIKNKKLALYTNSFSRLITMARTKSSMMNRPFVGTGGPDNSGEAMHVEAEDSEEVDDVEAAPEEEVISRY